MTSHESTAIPTSTSTAAFLATPMQPNDPTPFKWAHIPGFELLPPDQHDAHLYRRIREFNRIKLSHYDGGYCPDDEYPSNLDNLCILFFGAKEVPVMDEAYVRAQEDREKTRRLRFKERKERRANADNSPRPSERDTLHVPETNPYQTAPPHHHNKKRARGDGADGEAKDEEEPVAEAPQTRKRHRAGKTPRSNSDNEPVWASGGAASSSSTSQNLWNTPPLVHPDIAFRESLYDALADPQGAAFWERIYGQPIHIYSRTKVNPETGQIENMDDEQYVAYIKAEMFKKTQSGFIEEQKRRRERAQQAAQRAFEAEKAARERQRRAEDERKLQRDIERSLRRAEDRRKRRAREQRFDEYTKQWKDWDGEPASIPWPTETGSRKELSEKGIRSFFVRGLDLRGFGSRAFSAKLKEQRVRWHPDKMQQRLGGKDMVEKSVMADITMIFQVIDTLWDDTRKAT